MLLNVLSFDFDRLRKRVTNPKLFVIFILYKLFSEICKLSIYSNNNDKYTLLTLSNKIDKSVL